MSVLYLTVPIQLAKSKDFNQTEKFLIGLLRLYTNSGSRGCTKTNEQLAQDLGVSVESIKKAIKSLKDKKGISVKNIGRGRKINFMSVFFTQWAYIENNKKK